MKTHLTSVALAMCAVLAPAVSSAEASSAEVQELRTMMSQLLETMVARGVLTEDGATQMLQQAGATPASKEAAALDSKIEEMRREREALAADLEKLREERRQVTEQLEQSAVDKELLQNRQRRAIELEVQRQVEQALAEQARDADADVRVRYVPEFLLADIREQVKTELKDEVKTEIVEGVYAEQGEEGLPIPEVPEWVGKVKIGGDIRVRYQNDRVADDSGAWYDYSTINKNGGFNLADPQTDLLSYNNLDRDRLRGRLRVGIDAKIGYDFNAGIRLSTGNTGDPVSTNQTLGTGLNRYEVVLDRAFLGYKWTSDRGDWSLDAKGGRIPNPYYSSDLLWDSDLGFEGLSGAVTYKQDRPQKVFGIGTRGYRVTGTLGAFPLEESEYSSRDKWLYGGQVHGEMTLIDRTKLQFGVGYYTYDNITGVADSRPVAERRDARVDASVPLAMQKGNTLFDVYSAPNAAAVFDVFGLASDYEILNLTGGVEFPDFAPYHVWLTADYVKNLGYDPSEIRQRVGGADLTNPLDGDHDTGYMLRAEVGSPWMLDEGEWRLYLAYKHIEPDAVLDAYNDSDFLFGGTNAKGFQIGGRYVLQRDVELAFRYLDAKSTMNPIDPRTGLEIDDLKSSVFQLEINAKF
jgi:hypothetical protein